MSFPEHMDDGLELTVELLEQSADTLRLSYTARNGAGVEAYLINRLFRLGERGPEVDDGLVYITRDGDGVALRKQMLDVPDDVKVETPELPYATRLPAGEAFSQELRLALPLMPYSPYSAADEAITLDAETPIRFVLGYALADAPLSVREVARPGGPYLRIPYEELYERQRLKIAALREA